MCPGDGHSPGCLTDRWLVRGGQMKDPVPTRLAGSVPAMPVEPGAPRYGVLRTRRGSTPGDGIWAGRGHNRKSARKIGPGWFSPFKTAPPPGGDSSCAVARDTGQGRKVYDPSCEQAG